MLEGAASSLTARSRAARSMSAAGFTKRFAKPGEAIHRTTRAARPRLRRRSRSRRSQIGSLSQERMITFTAALRWKPSNVSSRAINLDQWQRDMLGAVR